MNRRWLMLLLILITLGPPAWSATPQLPGVATVTVRHAPHALPIHTSGRLAHPSPQQLAFKIGGLVAQVQVAEGERVRAGQRMALLEQDEIAAQVAQAQSRYREAAQRLQRYRKLHRQQALSSERLQEAETAVAVAQAELRIARFNQQHAQIIAPADGRVLHRHIEPNELVSPNQPAFTLAQDAGGWVVKLGVSDREVVRLNTGDRAAIQLDALPGQPLQGHVREIAAVADARTGLYNVELALGPTALPLRAGFIARVTLYPSVQPQAARIPLASVIAAQGPQGTVFVLGPQQRIEARQVVLGELVDGAVLVYQGLRDGERIITLGAADLQPGMQVRVRPDDAPAVQTAPLELGGLTP